MPCHSRARLGPMPVEAADVETCSRIIASSSGTTAAAHPVLATHRFFQCPSKIGTRRPKSHSSGSVPGQCAALACAEKEHRLSTGRRARLARDELSRPHQGAVTIYATLCCAALETLPRLSTSTALRCIAELCPADKGRTPDSSGCRQTRGARAWLWRYECTRSLAARAQAPWRDARA